VHSHLTKTPILLIQTIIVVFAMLSGWAWIKSATLQLRPDKRPSGWIDRQMNRISEKAEIWNAIAAFLSAFAAVTAGLLFLTAM
jgi:hypothetical protein